MADSIKQKEFLELLDGVEDRLSRFARAMSRSREDARDLVSETILIAYERFDKIENKSKFKSYLFTIASRLHRRRLWRLRFFGKYDEEKAELIPNNNTSQDTLADVAALYKALDKLPAKQREAIVLFEISGFSLEEIRTIQGGTLSGVKSRLKRARERLIKIMGTDDSTTNEQINYNNVNLLNSNYYKYGTGYSYNLNTKSSEIYMLKVKNEKL
jgi:RNA polymerase sigma-70 factor, ECF subfamily